MKHKVEYVWLDGYKPEPNLRSKTKIITAAAGLVLEDRRPASNADPYRIVRVIEESLSEV
jgi:hypothetical protein